MAKTKYNLHLKGYVGGWDFDSDYVDFVLNKNTDKGLLFSSTLSVDSSTPLSLYHLHLGDTAMFTSTLWA